MKNKNEPIPAGGLALCALVFICAILTRDAFTLQKGFPWSMLVCLPLLIIALNDMREKMPVRWSLPGFSRLRYYIETILHKGR